MRTRATVVWHSNESCSGGYIVIADEELTTDFLAKKVLDSDFEPDHGEFIDQNTISMVKVVRDGEVIDVPVSELLRAYDKDRFAVLGWCPGDVLAHRPEWTEGQARDWLNENAQKLQGVLSERGNEVLSFMLPQKPLEEVRCYWRSNKNGYLIKIMRGDEQLHEWVTPVAMVDGNKLMLETEIRRHAQEQAEKCAKSFGAVGIIHMENE